MSSLFGSTVIKGTRITEFSETTATVGVVIPFGYGRFTSGGNVGWAPLPPKEHRALKRQGKGGVKQETFTYTLSYAIYFAKGPIYGYWWIKRNGKVVYTQDPAAPVEDAAYAAKWLEKATFYYGTATQLPDSTIESYEGSGMVSGFHGDAYIVVEDDDTTQEGGAVPTYEACVVADGVTYSTSRPYPIETTEEYRPVPAIASAQLYMIPTEMFSVAVNIVSGELREPVHTYLAPPEEYVPAINIVSGILKSIVVNYSAPAEMYEVAVNIVSGALKTVVIPYNAAPESYAPSINIVSGVLS